MKWSDLEGRFGRGRFARLNERYRIFDVRDAWGAKTTKAYRVQDDIEVHIRVRQNDLLTSGSATTRLIRPDGKAVRRLRQPSVSRNLRGLSAALLDPERLLVHTAVDLEALSLLEQLLARADVAGNSDRQALLRRLDLAAGVRVDDLRAMLLRVGVSARIDIVGRGFIAHEYVMAEIGGRLFAQGVNLQSSPRIIKRFALNGLYEYDFSNCHLTVFVQLAEPLGAQLEAVRGYLANKKALRREIAIRVGITEEEVKQCILALTYGAQMSVREEDAIPTLIGKDAARRLNADPGFRPLNRELKRGRAAILEAWPTWRGAIRNAIGLPLAATRAPAQRLAHILQGVETQALLAILRAHSDDIVLLEHDGFVARRPLDVVALESLVLAETGFALRLEAQQIRLPAVV